MTFQKMHKFIGMCKHLQWGALCYKKQRTIGILMIGRYLKKQFTRKILALSKVNIDEQSSCVLIIVSAIALSTNYFSIIMSNYMDNKINWYCVLCFRFRQHTRFCLRCGKFCPFNLLIVSLQVYAWINVDGTEKVATYSKYPVLYRHVFLMRVSWWISD